MKEFVGVAEEHGTKVFAFAPSTDASRIVLRKDGFAEADTVATLLVNQKLQETIREQLIWIDEAGLMDSKTTGRVLELADRLDARVLLSGDPYQHHSVARGDVLRMLETEAGIKPVEVNTITRQKDNPQYREAIQALSEHRIEDGYTQLDKLGWIKELPYSERYKEIAADYLQAVKDKKTALVVCPTHLEGERVTDVIREGLRDNKNVPHRQRLKGEDKTFLKLENAHFTDAQRGDAANYQSGDVLVFHQNAKGFKRGQRLTIDANTKIPIEQADRFQVFRPSEIEFAKGDAIRVTHNGPTADGEHRLESGSVYRIRRFTKSGDIVLDNGWHIDKEYGHLAHGYVATSHASQGKTYERVFVAQGRVSFGASSAEQFYVSASRGTKQVTIYTEDKEELLDAVKRSEDRVTAIEFVNSPQFRQMMETREQEREAAAKAQERQVREREELVYER